MFFSKKTKNAATSVELLDSCSTSSSKKSLQKEERRGSPKKEKNLRKAERAERVWDTSDFARAGVEHAFLAVLQQHGDGAWVCPRGHENHVTHYHGKYPLKYVQCGKCDHVLCANCPSSDLLKPLTDDMLETLKDFCPALREELRVCQICQSCGLSHRLIADRNGPRFPKTCHCGHNLREDDFRTSIFRIGDVKDWRCDPASVMTGLKKSVREPC